MAQTAGGTYYAASSELVSSWPATSLDLANQLESRFAAKLNLAGGKILQIVRATDTTKRTTTSTTLVDANISVTITPQKSTSAVLLIWGARVTHEGTSNYTALRIADSSNNAISGAETVYIGSSTTSDAGGYQTIIGYDTPGTTSAKTYKGRFACQLSGTAVLNNDQATGQLFAIEVSA